MPPESHLLSLLQQEIRAAGPISFHRFMELCLYHPEYGYYNTERTKLGASGDFYTSAHVAPVFARLLARHGERLWRELGSPDRFDLVELGPGDGQLAGELLSWVEQRFADFFPCLRYFAVEQSLQLRKQIQERLARFEDRITILPSLPSLPREPRNPSEPNPPSRPNLPNAGFHGCLFANEFIDALPVHWLIWRDGGWRERRVGLGSEKLVWIETEPTTSELIEIAELSFDAGLLKSERENGWVAEISPAASDWMERISGCLARGQALIIDYGYTLTEWQHGRFPQGSALAYRRHQALDDVLAHPGDQDLTAHVNFTQLIEAGERAGLRLQSLQSQSRFLLALGEENEFADIFGDCSSEIERLRRSQLLKTLILPQGMGETFRALLMQKRLDQ
ncbi:MAG: SAM-dependent methyltransferase [Acidobacteria bacterium]|nr:SAM-dependent methyltransferase [Acidobacteriota bacterium]